MFGFSRIFGRLMPSLFFDGSAGGGGSGSSTDNGSGAGEGETSPEADKNAGDKKKTPEKKEVSFTAEQQEYIDKMIIPERLNRAKFDAEKVAEKARKKAEEEALQKNQEFEKLATTRQARIEQLEKQVQDELTPMQEQLKSYQDAVAAIVKVQTDRLPKAVKVLIEKMDPLAQMQYLTENAKELNIDFKAVPPSDTDESNPKARREVLEKARKQNEKTVQGFFR